MIVTTVAQLGARLRERRRELGWSQSAVAERLGVTRQWIASVEHGKGTVEAGLVLDALRALGLVVDVRPRDGDLPSVRAVAAVTGRDLSP